jgi:hypothetical protein
MDRIDQMRPWLVAWFRVTGFSSNGAAGLMAENGVDAVLLRRAMGRRRSFALESYSTSRWRCFGGICTTELQETWLSRTYGLTEIGDMPAYTRCM